MMSTAKATFARHLHPWSCQNLSALRSSAESQCLAPARERTIQKIGDLEPWNLSSRLFCLGLKTTPSPKTVICKTCLLLMAGVSRLFDFALWSEPNHSIYFFPDTLPIPSSPTPSLEEEDQLDPQWLLSSSPPIRQPLIEMMGNMSPFAIRW